MTAPIPGEGFRIATGFLEVVARVEKAEREVDELNRRVDRKLGEGGERGGESYGKGFLRGFRVQLFKLPRLLSNATASFLRGTLKLTAYGAAAGVVTAAVGGLASAIASLVPALAELVHVTVLASGSLLLIPGAIAAIISVVGAAKLGLSGFGKVIREFRQGDVKGLNEALAKLAPNARAVVRVVQGLQPAFTRLRLGVQQTLFARLADLVRRLGTSWLPVLSAGLLAMAGVLNGAVREAITFFLAASTRLDFATVFAASATSVANLAAALRPLLHILTDVTVVGATLLAQLTRGIGPAVAAFADRVSALRASGGLAAMITEGLSALGQFKDLAVDIFGIIKGIFGAAGGSQAGGLFAFFDRLNKLINSVAGQDALGRIFTALADVGVALTPVLLVLLQALVPLAQAISRVGAAFAPSLIALIHGLAGGLVALEPAIIALAPALATASSFLPALGTIISRLVTAFAPGIVQLLLGLGNALMFLGPIAPEVGRALGLLATVLAKLLVAAAPVIAQVLGAVATTLLRLAPAVEPLIRALLPKLLAFLGGLLAALAPILPALMRLGDAFLSVLVANLPQIIALTDRLLPLVVGLAMAFGQQFADALDKMIPLLPGLVLAALQLGNAFADFLVALKPLLPLILFLLSQQRLWILTINGVTGGLILLTSALDQAVFFIRVIGGLIDGVRTKFGDAGKATETFGTAVKTNIAGAMLFMRNLGTTILTSIGNFGHLLFDAGAHLIDGLIAGIRSKFPDLGNVMGSMAQRVRDFWPFSPAKTGPLSGQGDPRIAGRKTIQRYAEGADNELARIGMLLGAGMAAMAANMAPAPAAAAAVASPVHLGGIHVIARLGRREFDMSVEDAMVGNPRAVAAAAEEGQRQRMFTDSSRRRLGVKR